MSAGEFFVDHSILRRFVATTEAILKEQIEVTDRLRHLRRSYAELLNDQTWLPDEFRQPNFNSAMGGGIASWLLYRSEAKDLSLFSLVVPVGAATPVHDHLAWGLVGIYRGRQDETVYRRLDDGRDPARADLEVAKRQELGRGECYTLLPPTDDIHYVSTISDTPSISIHLLANDTACVWRHKFEPATGVVTPFRSGYANAPCPPEP